MGPSTLKKSLIKYMRKLLRACCFGRHGSIAVYHVTRTNRGAWQHHIHSTQQISSIPVIRGFTPAICVDCLCLRQFFSTSLFYFFPSCAIYSSNDILASSQGLIYSIPSVVLPTHLFIKHTRLHSLPVGVNKQWYWTVYSVPINRSPET